MPRKRFESPARHQLSTTDLAAQAQAGSLDLAKRSGPPGLPAAHPRPEPNPPESHRVSQKPRARHGPMRSPPKSSMRYARVDGATHRAMRPAQGRRYLETPAKQNF